MRYSRQNTILEIISNHDVETQTELCNMLIDKGYKAVSYTHLTLPTNSRV